MECADSMTEAIKKLLTNEYICVGINADAIDFMPLLSTMRSVTNIPILIATGNFSTEKEVAALNSGADLYARWHESPEDNVSSVLSHIARKTARNATPRKIIAYRNLIIAPAQRYAFIDNEPLELTRHEFDLLLCLLDYQGRVLSYMQIYRTVWNDEYNDSSYEAIKGLMKRLRKKLAESNASQIDIENVRGIGYRLPEIPSKQCNNLHNNL